MKHHLIEQRKYDMPRLMWLACVCTAIVMLVSMPQSASAQSGQPDNGKSEIAGEKGKSEIAKYVRNKYKVRYMDSQLQKTEHGPSGSIYIIGDITPKDIVPAMAETKKPDRARGMAKALILDEPDLFGVINQRELKEAVMKTDELGVAHIRYRRTLNDIPLNDMEIMVHIGPNDRISSISARVVPIPPALHWEVTRKTLGEDVLLPIIAEDLMNSNIKYKDLKVLGKEKVAITEPPYVIWISDISLLADTGRWIYKIDAFTGKVIEKTDALVE